MVWRLILLTVTISQYLQPILFWSVRTVQVIVWHLIFFILGLELCWESNFLKIFLRKKDVDGRIRLKITNFSTKKNCPLMFLTKISVSTSSMFAIQWQSSWSKICVKQFLCKTMHSCTKYRIIKWHNSEILFEVSFSHFLFRYRSSFRYANFSDAG